MTKGFVYCWTDHKNNMLYVGSHKGVTDDGYICSSKYMMKEYKKRPHDFTRQIIAEGLLDDIRRLETKILQEVNAKLDESFYNKHQNDGFFFDGWSSENMTEEHRRNIGISSSKVKRSEEHIKKLNEGRRKSKNKPEHNEAIKNFQKKRKESGYYQSEQHKKVISDSRKKVEQSKRKEISSIAGKESQKKRKESGYYQSEEWKEICRNGWKKRKGGSS